MVVPMSQLGRLVRQTVIHAARIAAAPPPLPPTPSSAGMPGSATGAAITAAVATSGVMGTGGMAGFMGVSTPGASVGSAGGPGAPLGHRTSGFHHVQQSSSGSTTGSVIQSHPYSVHPGTHAATPTTGTFSAGYSVSSTVGFGTGAGPIGSVANIYGSTGAGLVSSTTASHSTASSVPGISAVGASGIAMHLAASSTNLANVGTGSNAASVVSLISNSGSVHGGVPSINTGPGMGGSAQHIVAAGPSQGANITSANGGGSTSTLSTLTTITSITSAQPSLHMQQPQQFQYPHSLISSAAQSQASFSSTVVARNAHPFKQRATSIQQLVKRHKVDKWTYQQFMEQVFGYSHTHQHSYHGRA